MNRMNMTSMLLAAALAIVAALPAEAKKKKQQAPKPPKSAYQKLMDKGGRISAEGGFVNLHKIQGKLYVALLVAFSVYEDGSVDEVYIVIFEIT